MSNTNRLTSKDLDDASGARGITRLQGDRITSIFYVSMKRDNRTHWLTTYIDPLILTYFPCETPRMIDVLPVALLTPIRTLNTSPTQLVTSVEAFARTLGEAGAVTAGALTLHDKSGECVWVLRMTGNLSLTDPQGQCWLHRGCVGGLGGHDARACALHEINSDCGDRKQVWSDYQSSRVAGEFL